MAVRVLLLFGFTGLFAAAWNADHPASATPRLASVPRLPEAKLADTEVRYDWMVSETNRGAGSSSEFEPSAISLPESITSGTYRVVDVQGRVGWLTIFAGDRSASVSGEPESLFVSQSKSERWYFIRVKAAPVIAAPQTSDAIRR